MDFSRFNGLHRIRAFFPSVAEGNLHALERRLTEKLKITSAELRMVLGGLLLSSLVIVIVHQPKELPPPKSAPVEIATLIPEGQALVPIELKNFESVDSILGPFGYVDLHAVVDGQPSKLVARNVKILRAPKNPNLFAALVAHEFSARLIEADERGLYAVIKNKPEAGTEFVIPSSKRNRISYGTEEL